ncbi:MAG: hypothetical protein ACFN23_07140, partial [Capnocytophaga gingivalis]
AFYTLLAAAFFAAGMWPEIDNTVWRMAYRTALLLVFVGIIINEMIESNDIIFYNLWHKNPTLRKYKKPFK